MKKPSISIIMSTYNDELYIAKSIGSVLSQKFKSWEFIIISDASSDKTDRIIKSFAKKDPRIIFLRNDIRKGVTANIKTLLEKSSSSIIARIDGDDYWCDDNKLSEQYNEFKVDKDLGVIGTWASVVDKEDNFLYEIKYSLNDEDIRSKFLRENSFVTSSVMFRKPSNNQINSIDLLNKYADDYNLWLKIGINARLKNINKIYTVYRINPLGLSQSKYQEQLNDTIKTVRYYHNYYPNFKTSIILWNLRKYYPTWIKGRFSMRIKTLLNSYAK